MASRDSRFFQSEKASSWKISCPYPVVSLTRLITYQRWHVARAFYTMAFLHQVERNVRTNKNGILGVEMLYYKTARGTCTADQRYKQKLRIHSI